MLSGLNKLVLSLCQDKETDIHIFHFIRFKNVAFKKTIIFYYKFSLNSFKSKASHLDAVFWYVNFSWLVFL